MAAQPLTQLPYTPSLEPAFMDRSVDPCTDLYTYACGGWMRQNPIPADQAHWDVYGKLADENNQFLWGILQEAANPSAQRSPEQQKIGDFFAACMDEVAVQKRAAMPLHEDLQRIAALSSRAEIIEVIASSHRRGEPMLFEFDAEQDPDDSRQVIAWVGASGLGMPDRDYYVKNDTHSVTTRARYLDHVTTMLTLAGQPKAEAARDAKRILRFETRLAHSSLTRVEHRDPHRTHHKMALRGLQRLSPALSWEAFFRAVGAPSHAVLNVTEPAFVRALDAALRSETLATWRAYLRWHVIDARAAYLSEDFVQADFSFHAHYLHGVPELAPRWKRCTRWVDYNLGEALGKVFVDKAFDAETRQKTVDMLQRIETAMRGRIEKLDWMSPATKRGALAKLATLRNKIGYPDKWRDYSAVEIRPDDFFGNLERAEGFEARRQLAKIGKPVDREEWDCTAPTVNAYYSGSMNDMNFPAGVLMPPLFDARLDDAPNYGNTGSTIGHELTHAFDDEGRQFDAKGNLEDWWTSHDAAEFKRRAACIKDQYAQYVVIDELKVNSSLTLGEDIADLGGTILAWQAWKAATAGQTLEARDDLTPEQRFFVGCAQWACENQRDADKRASAVTNPHSPARYRVNGVVANMPDYAAAFSCKTGQPLVRPRPCRVW